MEIKKTFSIMDTTFDCIVSEEQPPLSALNNFSVMRQDSIGTSFFHSGRWININHIGMLSQMALSAVHDSGFKSGYVTITNVDIFDMYGNHIVSLPKGNQDNG